MKKAFLLLSVLGVCFAAQVNGQQKLPAYTQRIAIINNNINTYLRDDAKNLYFEDTKPESKKRHSYLWPLCAYIQAADEMDKLEPKKNRFDTVMKAIGYYYNNNPPLPAYQASPTLEERDDRYYDDNQWVAIACLDAYDRTHAKKYLDVAKMIHRFQLTGYDNKAGGGLYWKEKDYTTKNTCSNGPAVLVALQLYKVTNEQHYLDTALLIYNWTNAHLQAPNGVFYDNLKIPSLKIDSAFYTYNAGTMLQANVLLYNITKNSKYLTEAKRIADAAEKHFYRNGKLPGNYWFNAVLLRGLMELYKVEKNKSRLQYFIADADRVWREERAESNMLGTDSAKSLIAQAAMIEIYGRLNSIK